MGGDAHSTYSSLNGLNEFIASHMPFDTLNGPEICTSVRTSSRKEFDGRNATNFVGRGFLAARAQLESHAHGCRPLRRVRPIQKRHPNRFRGRAASRAASINW